MDTFGTWKNSKNFVEVILSLLAIATTKYMVTVQLIKHWE